MLWACQGRSPQIGGLRSLDEHRGSDMLKHSTVESVEARQPTLLACAETLISIAVYGFIAWRYQTYVHFVVAAVFAPLFLLRTQESTDWLHSAYLKSIHGASEVASKHLRAAKNRPVWGVFSLVLIGFLMMSYTVVSGFFSRFISVLYWLSIRFLRCIKAIPQNWFQQTFCVDVFFLPELIPQENLRRKNGSSGPFQLLGILWDEIKRSLEKRVEVSWLYSIYLIVVMFPPTILAYGISLFYRIGFKATSIFYFPLVWVSNTGLNDGRPVYERLSRFGAGEIEKARRALSLVIAPIVALKAAVMLDFIDLKVAMEYLIKTSWLETFLNPGFWTWWIVAVTVEIVLTFVLFFFADEAIARKDGTKPWPVQRVESIAAALITLRSAVAVVLVCSGVVFAVSAFLKTI